ncbi:unnamed protein product, partial [Mesorhabditis belari]
CSKDEEQAEIRCLNDSIMVERHGAQSAQENQARKVLHASEQRFTPIDVGLFKFNSGRGDIVENCCWGSIRSPVSQRSRSLLVPERMYDKSMCFSKEESTLQLEMPPCKKLY